MDKIIRINLLEALKIRPRTGQQGLRPGGAGPRPDWRGHSRGQGRHVPVVFVPVRRLDLVAPGHQGVMAEVAPKKYATLEEILARSAKPFVVILDEVEDPQNWGPSSAAPRGPAPTASSCPKGVRPG